MKKQKTGVEQLTYLPHNKVYVNKAGTKYISGRWVAAHSIADLDAILAAPEDPAGTFYDTQQWSESYSRGFIATVREQQRAENQ